MELCSLNGPSGFEGPVAARVREMLGEFMDETWIDTMGNVIGVRRCGIPNARKLLLDAHIDEIGLVVTGAEEGFLRFASIGGLDVRMLPASGVEILTDPPRYGVIATLPPHVLKKEDTAGVMGIEDLFIDVGLTQEEAEAAVPLGTPGVLSCGVRSIDEQMMVGKAFDDRAGFVAILRAVELLAYVKLDFDLFVMASVQEEVGVRGAAPGVYAVAPDWSFVVDVDFAKTPDTKPFEVRAALGGGVIISSGPNMSPSLTKLAIETAKQMEIKHQLSVEPGGNSGTNARAIQISREGVATALLGIPLRYMHSPRELVSLEDIECTARLLCEMTKRVGGDTI
ncbi:MAG: M20/M25/M40 family metallo-hydrolase [Oscillospiraceae bacterium]|nr:M20/M25/M40 family metallo-hydrolase [Oscillospiraceae bacterium]